MGFLIFVFVVCVVILVFAGILRLYLFVSDKNAESRRQENQPIMDRYQEEYKEMVQKHNEARAKIIGTPIKRASIDASTFAVRRSDGLIFIYAEKPVKQPFFKDDGTPVKATDGSFTILFTCGVNCVLFWAEKGSLQYTTQTSGNGSQVATNALKGAVLAGTAGAIVGGLGTMGAQSQTVTHDTRKIVVKLTNGNEVECPYAYRQAFITCMPEKEYEFLKMSNRLN